MTNEQKQFQNELKQAIQQVCPVLTFEKEVNCGDVIELADPENYIRHEEVKKSYFGDRDTWTDVWYEGITLNIEETWRSNGTNENKSFYLRVLKWNRHSGSVLFRVKISQKDSLKKRERLINETVNAYNMEVL